MTAKKRKPRKKIPLPKGLLNWPPSRGPMPDALRAKPVYVVPDVEIEYLPWTPNTRGGRLGRPKPPARVPPPALTAKDTRGMSRETIKHMKAGREAGREITLALIAHVVTIGTLKPGQWDLITGSVWRPARKVKSRLRRRPGMRHIRGHVRIETFLPTRTLTFDIDYPLNATARVTIKPYTMSSMRRRRGDREEGLMTVGYVLWQLARAYKVIYKQWRKYGIWGHAITDLCFEGLTIKDNVGDVLIGS